MYSGTNACGLSSVSGDVLRQWAIEGRGISLEAGWDLAEDLQAGRLVRCLSGYACGNVELFATFHPGHPLPPRIRLVADFKAAAMAKLSQ
jgi:DNA-binding transcriptional LysR family regulator